MNREEGYYWVKYKGEWTIGQYRLHKQQKAHDGSDMYFWAVPAYIDDGWWLYDTDFDEIDERRITR